MYLGRRSEGLLGTINTLAVDPEPGLAGARRSPTRASTYVNRADMGLQQHHNIEAIQVNDTPKLFSV